MKRRLLITSSFSLLTVFVILLFSISLASRASAAGTIDLEFDGLSRDLAQPLDLTETPDMSGAVGLNQYIQAVNLQIAIYDKNPDTSNPIIPLEEATFDEFFNLNDLIGTTEGINACDNANKGQPQVLNDHMSGSWIITDVAYLDGNIDSGPYYQCIAISISPSPTLQIGQWYQYAIPIHPDYLHDQPKFGLWPDGIYMAADLYDVWNNGLHRTPKGVTVWAFNRDDLVVGNPTPATQSFYISESAGYSGLLPSNLLGPPPPNGTPNYFAAINPPNQFLTWEFHVDWINTSNSTFTGPKTTIVNSFTPVVGFLAPQQGDSENLDIVGQRLMPPLQYRYQTDSGTEPMLWANHTVGNGSEVGVRWYEFRNLSAASHTVYQQGTYSAPADGSYRWLASMAVDRQGNMALAYSKSSPTMNPAIFQTGRMSTDPLGQLIEPELPFKQGSGWQDIDALDEGPWGSYSSMSLDPYNECHFWYTNQYYDAGQPTVWKTRITKFHLFECDPLNPGVVTRVSLDTNDVQAIGGGSGIYGTDISADGRYVVFESEADNLVNGDNAGHVDIFVRDRDADGNGVYDEPGPTGVTTTRVSYSYLGVEANGDSGVGVTGDFGHSSVSISADGRYVAYSSVASNLIPNDTNGTTDVFVYDRVDGDTVRVSVDQFGNQGNAVSDQPSLSADGRFIVYRSYANNLLGLGNDTNTYADIFLHDRDSDENEIFDEVGGINTIRVSVDSGGAQAINGHSYTPDISPSADGRFVTFASDATNLDVNDLDNLTDIFVHDRDPDANGIMDEPGLIATTLVSIDNGNPAGEPRSYNPTISANGQFVTFASQPTVAVAGETMFSHIYVRDRTADATTLVSVDAFDNPAHGDSYRPAISMDGSHIAFESIAGNLWQGDNNGLRDIYVMNLATLFDPVEPNEIRRASFGYDDSVANGASFWPSISETGQHTSYASNANNLVKNDTNNLRDVFVHDRDAIRPPGPALSIPQGEITAVYAGEEVDVPIRFNSNGHDISSVVFAIDLSEPCWIFDPTDSNADNIPDDVNFTLPAGFWQTATYDADNLRLEITAYGFPTPATLPDSDIVTLTLTAACQPPINGSFFKTLRFSTVPGASFGDTAGQNVPGTTQNGAIEILFNNVGDCNGDSMVNAADITALVLEIFDGDGQLPENVPGGSFVGDVRGCNANQDGVVDSGDISCTILIIFDGFGACSGLTTLALGPSATVPTSSFATLNTTAVGLTIPDLVEVAPGKSVELPISFSPDGNEISSLVLSIDYDETWLSLDPTDSNGDGTPDAVSFNVPAGFVAAAEVNVDDHDGEIDVVIYDFATPLTAIPEGVLLTVTLDAADISGAAIAPVNFSQEPAASFGNSSGQSIAGSTDDGSVLIGLLNERAFLPLVMKP